MNKKSRSKDKHSIAKKQVETSPLLPSTDILQNLIGGPELHVPDWLVWKHIHKNSLAITGLPHFILWVDHILEKSSGRINRPQWHCRDTMMKTMQMKGNNLSRFESAWIESGWIRKVDSGGRVPSKRVLGWQFDFIRIQYCVNPIQIEAGCANSKLSQTSNPIQIESSNPIQNESGCDPNPIQIESPNPNLLLPNQIKEEKDARAREPDSALRDSKKKVKMTEEEKKEAIRRKCNIIQMHMMQMKKR